MAPNYYSFTNIRFHYSTKKYNFSYIISIDQQTGDEGTHVSDVCPCPSPRFSDMPVSEVVSMSVSKFVSKLPKNLLRVCFGNGLGHELMFEVVSVSVSVHL